MAVIAHPAATGSWDCIYWESRKESKKASLSREEKETASIMANIMAKAIGSTPKEVEKVAKIVKETNKSLDMGPRKKPITAEEVVKLINEYDKKPDKSKMDFYMTHMKIVLGNEMINLETWDNIYTQAEQNAAYKKAEAIQIEALKIIGGRA